MKRLAFLLTLTVLVAPVYAAAAKDAGPSTRPATKAETMAKKSAPPASQPAIDLKKGPVKVEGEVEISNDTKVTQDNEIDILGMIYGIWTNFKAGKVWDGIAILLMVLTFLFGKFKTDIPVKYLPWIAAGLGIATNIVSALVGGVEWGSAVTSGLFQGAAAAGFWSMVGKHLFRSKEEKLKRAQARDLAEKSMGVKG